VPRIVISSGVQRSRWDLLFSALFVQGETSIRNEKISAYRTTPSSGELAVAYSFFIMRPAR
jgi:hypothetical protein